jgi:hypothetical protein
MDHRNRHVRLVTASGDGAGSGFRQLRRRYPTFLTVAIDGFLE